jgi:secreted trypsin-like serine protease
LDIEYEFFEVNFGGQPAWAAGNYLNLEQKAYCSQYPCGAPQSNSYDLNNSKQSRVIGGSDATRNAWPWQLVLETGTEGDWNLACGAVLIGSNWALTSADCLRGVQYPIRILAGVHARSDPILPEQIRLVDEADITVHPDFSSTDLANNIAIIQFTEPYDLSTNRIRNVCLPPGSSTLYYENPGCYLTGWGINQADGTSPVDVLQRAGIDVIRPANCELFLGSLPLQGEVCTYDQVSRTVSACTGDMGGPLSCLVNTRFQLAGVASYTADQCNPRRPQVYTSIPTYIDWIKEVTGIE